MQFKEDVQLLVTHVSTGPLLTIDHTYDIIASKYIREDPIASQ